MAVARRILVPIDFSEHSKQALDFVVEHAGELGVETVVLLHVHYPPVVAIPIDGGMSTVAAAQATAEDHELLKQELFKEAAGLSSPTLTVKTLVVTGTPAETICDLAERERIDLIVMGTRGRTGLAHVVLGSVAERTLRLAPCPVLTMKSDADDD